MPRGRALRAVMTVVLATAITGYAVRGPLLEPRVADTLPRSVELASTPFFPQTAYQCGPAALATVLGASGAAATPGELEPRVYLPGRRGSLQAELIAAARTQDRIPYPISPDIGALLAEVADGRPVLVLQNLGLPAWPRWHYAVVIGYDLDRDRMLLRSGTQPRLALRGGRFLGTWYRAEQWALVMLRPGELPAGPDPQRYRAAVSAFESTRGAEAALAAWEAAVATWPDDAVARVGVANGRYAHGDLDGALEALVVARALAPDDPVVGNNLAHVLHRKGCHAAALREITDTLDRLPSDDPRRVHLAETAARITSRVADPMTDSGADSGARPASPALQAPDRSAPDPVCHGG